MSNQVPIHYCFSSDLAAYQSEDRKAVLSLNESDFQLKYLDRTWPVVTMISWDFLPLRMEKGLSVIKIIVI